MLKTYLQYRNIRFTFVLAGLALFLMTKGLAGLGFRLTHWAPKQMTCAEFAAASSKPRWVELTDCRVDVLMGQPLGYSDSDGCFVLLTTPSGDTGAKGVVLLSSTDPEYVDAVRRFGAVPGTTTPPRDQLPFQQLVTVVGLDRPEFELDATQHSAYARLARAYDNLPILVQGATPAFFGPLLYVIGALLAAGGCLLNLNASGEEEEALAPARRTATPRR